MKGIRKVEDKTGFFLSLNIEEMNIIKKALNTLLINYNNLLGDKYINLNQAAKIQIELNKVNDCLKTIKQIEDEAKN